MVCSRRAYAALAFAFFLYASASAQTGKRLVINNFVSDPSEIEAHVVVSDVDGIGPNIKISIFAEDGRMVYERYETLSAFGKLNYDPYKQLNAFQHGYNQNPKFRGTIRIESDAGNIIGQYWQFYKKTDKKYMNFAVPAADGAGYDMLVCQHFVSDKNIDASVIVANVEANRPVTVQTKFYSDEGGLVASDRITVPANGVVHIDPYKATKGLRMTGTAYLNVIGAGKITGEYWQLSSGEKYQIALPLEGVSKIR